MDNAFAGRLRFRGNISNNDSGAAAASNAASSLPAADGRPFICVNASVDVAMLAGFVVNTWQVPAPDIIITVCSGLRTSPTALNKQPHRYTLQRGFTKLFRTANVWIFTHGCHAGFAALIGEAVQREQDRRAHIVLLRKASSVAQRKFYNQSLPKILLFGMPALRTLRDASCFFNEQPTQSSLSPSSFADSSSVNTASCQQQQRATIVTYTLNAVNDSSSRKKHDLDPFHTHFIVVNDTDDTNSANTNQLTTSTFFRGRLEQELHLYHTKEHKAAAAAASAEISSSDEAFLSYSSSADDDDNDDISGVESNDNDEIDRITSQEPQQQPTTKADVFVRDSRIPMVALVVEGGIEQLEQIIFYLRAGVPCVVMKGTGLMADILAAVYEDLFLEGASSFDDADMQALRTDTTSRLKRQFSSELASRKSLDACFDKIVQIMRLTNQQHGRRKLLSILNLNISSDFVFDLDKFVLNALFASQNIGPTLLRKNAELLRKHLFLTLKWNCPLVARSRIFQSDIIGQWSRLRTDSEIFDQALMLKKRENFVDMFLEHGFKVHKYLSHRKLLQLFRRAEDTEFFHSVVLQGIMNYTAGSRIVHARFIMFELNPLIYQMTNLKEFINAYALTASTYGMGGKEDVVEARRRALLALLVWAIMLNRYDLAVVLWKHCDHPIPTALFAARLFTKMSEMCSEPELTEKLYSNGNKFGQMAIDILELGYVDGGALAFEVLETRFAEFGNKTVVVLAYEAENRYFLAHPCCQKWLNRLYQGRIDVQRHNLGPLGQLIPDAVKIVLSAWFILPMFMWIRFPTDFIAGSAAGGALRQHNKKNKLLVEPAASLFGNDYGKKNKTDDEENARATKDRTLQQTVGDVELGTVDGSGGGINSDICGLTGVAGPSRNKVLSSSAAIFTSHSSGLGANSVGTVGPTKQKRREHELAELAEEQRRAREGGLAKIRMQDEPLRSISKRVLGRSQKKGAVVTSSTSLDADDEMDAIAEGEEEARIPLYRKIYYLWQAPVTKYWTSLFAYVVFLTFYSIAAFVPDCDGVLHVDFRVSIPFLARPFSFAIDAVVWLWTALYALELALSTYRQYEMGIPFRLRRRCLEIGLLTVALVVYILIRSLTAVFRWFNPFTARVIMLLGLLYFYFRIISLFFPLSRELGPLLVRVQVMCTRALASFLKFLAPFMLAYTIIIQVVLYPDLQLSRRSVWQAVKRAIFMFFSRYQDEFDETKECSAKRFDGTSTPQNNRSALLNVNERATGLFHSSDDGYCITGDYTDATCPTSGFWTYFFVIQWLFIFKMVLMSMLYAFFTAYTLRITKESEQIWKYQRYQLVVDIATRSALPPPLSIISHLLWLGYSVGLGAVSFLAACYRACCRCCCSKRGKVAPDSSCCGFPISPPPASWSGTDSDRSSQASASYWQAVAQQFWRDHEREEMEKSKPEKQYLTILALKEDVDMARSSIRRMRNKLMVQEKMLTNVAQLMANLSSAAATTASATASRPASAPHTNQTVVPMSAINSTSL